MSLDTIRSVLEDNRRSSLQEPVVPVRDSKVPHGPALCFEAPAWAAFIGELTVDDHRH
jgi:hypothetical protein